jgi:hypothetical protein
MKDIQELRAPLHYEILILFDYFIISIKMNITVNINTNVNVNVNVNLTIRRETEPELMLESVLSEIGQSETSCSNIKIVLNVSINMNGKTEKNKTEKQTKQEQK